MTTGVGYNRCPNDDPQTDKVHIGVNPNTGCPIELDVNGVASVMAIQSAILTLGAALKGKHEVDFLEKVSLCLFERLLVDPHALCPLITICGMCLLMITKQAEIEFSKDGHVVIVPRDTSIDVGSMCVFDEDKKGENGDGNNGVSGL